MTLAKLSLCVLTPHASEAALTSGYMKTIRALDRALDSGAWRIDEGTTQLGIDTGLDMQIDRHVRAPADVVRTRCRLARLFLEGSSADYAIWLDDDNDCSDDITILPRMIALAHQLELAGSRLLGHHRSSYLTG